MKPVIALVGRPNVGKSTLFNCLTKTRDAIVADFPGLTRDRKYGHGAVGDKAYIVIDTGGLSGEKESLDERMAKQTLLAIEEADLVLFIVDARDGMTAEDNNIASQLRRYGKTVSLVLNKIDGINEIQAQAEFYALGFGEIHAIAASQNRGIKTMIDSVLEALPASSADAQTQEPEGLKVAVVGRPNVGKSTLINRILGEERVVAFDRPGTTRDSVFIPFERDGQVYTLIDTAGVRRRGKVTQGVEKFSVIKTLQAIDQANVAVMVLDAHEGLSDQDMHLLSYIIESGRALVVAVNKWDGMDEYDKKRLREALDLRLGFVDFAEIFYISALHGTGVGHLYQAINKAYRSATRNLPTPELTRILQQLLENHQPPLVKGRRVKLRYAHQGGQNPPVIVVHGNVAEEMPAAYRRYLINGFRQILKLHGTPVRVEFKKGENPFAGRVNKLTQRQIAKRRRLMSYVKARDKERKQKRGR